MHDFFLQMNLARAVAPLVDRSEVYEARTMCVSKGRKCGCKKSVPQIIFC